MAHGQPLLGLFPVPCALLTVTSSLWAKHSFNFFTLLFCNTYLTRNILVPEIPRLGCYRVGEAAWPADTPPASTNAYRFAVLWNDGERADSTWQVCCLSLPRSTLPEGSVYHVPSPLTHRTNSPPPPNPPPMIISHPQRTHLGLPLWSLTQGQAQ